MLEDSKKVRNKKQTCTAQVGEKVENDFDGIRRLRASWVFSSFTKVKDVIHHGKSSQQSIKKSNGKINTKQWWSKVNQ